jgi:hypothetical protein
MSQLLCNFFPNGKMKIRQAGLADEGKSNDGGDSQGITPRALG